METPKYQNNAKTSADMLRKYQDMILEHSQEVDDAKDEEVDESKEEELDEAKD